MTRWWMTMGIACLLASAGATRAQNAGEDADTTRPADPPQAEAPPAEKPAEEPANEAAAPPPAAAGQPDDDAAQEEGEDMPSLDELLGLEETEETGADASQHELEQALSGEQLGDAFIQAVDLMGSVAQRIQTQKDAGVQTQRLQEDILRRLDQLISSMEQQQQQSSSSSSSSSSQQQQQQPNQPQQQQQQRSNGSESNEHASAPELQEGPLRPNLEPVTAAWGNLPARVRDQLLQGIDDRFSALYENMTEAYYKRLAEEASEE